MKTFFIVTTVLITLCLAGCSLFNPPGYYVIDMEPVPSEQQTPGAPIIPEGQVPQGMVPMGPVPPQQTEPVLVGYTEEGKPIHFVPDPNAAPSLGQQAAGIVDYAGRLAIGMLPLPDPMKQPLKTAWTDLLGYGIGILTAGGAAAVGGSKVVRKIKASGPNQVFGPDPIAVMKKNGGLYPPYPEGQSHG